MRNILKCLTLILSVIILVVCLGTGCTITNNSNSKIDKKWVKDTVVIDSIKINGIDIKDFEIATNDMYEYKYPIETLLNYLKKYAGVTLKTSTIAEATSENLIIIGSSRYDGGKKYNPYQTAIVMNGTKICLGCEKQSSAESVVDMFIAKYLSGTGNLDATIPNDGSILYEFDGIDWSVTPSNLSLQDKIVRSCKKLQQILEYDHDQGKYYTYQNHKYEKTIADARAKDNRTTNCVIILNWVAKDIGLWGDNGIFNIVYDGTCGYQFEGEACAAYCEEYFEIIPNTKTEHQLDDEGAILPGDVLFFSGHMSMFIDSERAMDAGRGVTENISVGSKFKFWLGPNQCYGMQPGFIMRAKDASVF